MSALSIIQSILHRPITLPVPTIKHPKVEKDVIDNPATPSQEKITLKKHRWTLQEKSDLTQLCTLYKTNNKIIDEFQTLYPNLGCSKPAILKQISVLTRPPLPRRHVPRWTEQEDRELLGLISTYNSPKKAATTFMQNHSNTLHPLTAVHMRASKLLAINLSSTGNRSIQLEEPPGQSAPANARCDDDQAHFSPAGLPENDFLDRIWHSMQSTDAERELDKISNDLKLY